MQKTLVQRVVSVTPELIARGRRCNGHSCPVALALEQVGTVKMVVSTGSRVLIKSDDISFTHSGRLVRWIQTFDHYGEAEPIDIAIDVENRRLWIA